MHLGLVSNCWRVQLESGIPLETLIAEAARRGCRAVELRQTCLGSFESGSDHLPNAERLSTLPEEFPGVRFNVAICVPFLDPKMTPDDRVFAAGKWAAQAVCGENPPHLRLVDLTTDGQRLADIPFDVVSQSIARLVESLAAIDGVLSVENSRQPWQPFREIMAGTHKLLGLDSDRLRLCYDPCNLLFPGDDVDPTAVTASLSADELSMVHFKQRLGGRIQNVVCDGDIDWQRQLAALKQIGYVGPCLFEVESDEDLWELLHESIEYLGRLGLEDSAAELPG